VQASHPLSVGVIDLGQILERRLAPLLVYASARLGNDSVERLDSVVDYRCALLAFLSVSCPKSSYRTVQLVLLGPRQRLRRFLRCHAVNKVRAQPPAGDVIPIEKSGRPTVRKTHFETAAPGNGFMGNDPDASCHSCIEARRPGASALMDGSHT
jgi:hypothetical protein